MIILTNLSMSIKIFNISYRLHNKKLVSFLYVRTEVHWVIR